MRIKNIIFYILSKITYGKTHIKFKEKYYDTKVLLKCLARKDINVYRPYCLSDVTIGKGTYIAKSSHISRAKIGKFCSIGPNFFCGWGVHPIHCISTSPAFYSTEKQNGITFSKVNKIEERKDILIGNDVFIGMNVSILDGVHVADGAVIAAGAVVTENVPPYAVVGGVPAKIIKYRFTDEEISKLCAIKWWDWDDEKLKDVEKMFFNVTDFLDKHYKQ